MTEKHTILVVDDQFGVRKLLKEVLQSEDYEVFVAGGGDEALQFLKERAADLIVLDLKMPGMGGLEVIAAVKELGYQGPFILMTAYGELEVLQQAQQLGCNYYINKPFDVSALRQLIKEVLTGNKSTVVRPG